MSQVWFISDLHLAHKRVIEFCDNFRGNCLGVDTIEQHDQKLFDNWNETVHKRDKVFVLGDIGWGFSRMKALPGTKILHLGNHDTQKASDYLEVFDDIIGPIKHKKHWITHHPMHESELWGIPNIHGHTHSKGVADPRYINVCIEMCDGIPVNFEAIRRGEYTTHDRVRVEPYEE